MQKYQASQVVTMKGNANIIVNEETDHKTSNGTNGTETPVPKRRCPAPPDSDDTVPPELPPRQLSRMFQVKHDLKVLFGKKLHFFHFFFVEKPSAQTFSSHQRTFELKLHDGNCDQWVSGEENPK